MNLMIELKLNPIWAELKKLHGQAQDDSEVFRLKLPRSNPLYFCTLF